MGYRRSSDRGASWSPARRIADAGGSSHFVVGPAGELAARVIPLSASGAQHDADAEWILVSVDGGATWSPRAPPGEREYTGLGADETVPRWLEPLAWDDAGNLYYLWSAGGEVWLGRSSDRAASWLTWPVEQGGGRHFFPYLSAGPDGALAATWFTGAGDELAIRVVTIHDAAGDEPRVLSAAPFQAPAWTPTDPPVRDTAGEYVPVIWLAADTLGIATPLQDPTADRFGFTFRTVRIDR